MNRRRFLLSSGTAILASTSVNSAIQKPSVGLEFELAQVERKKPANTDSIILNFNKFQLTPRYIDTSRDLSLTIKITLKNIDTKTINKQVSIDSNQKITKTDIQLENPIIKNIKTEKDSIDGNIQITIDHPDIKTKTYNQSFIITLQIIPLQATGGNNTFEIVDQGNNVITRSDLGENETLDDYEGTQYRVHEFTKTTESQEFTVTRTGDLGGTIDALLVGGGGGGGYSGGEAGGGGGAGGLLYETNISVSEQSYTVTVGDGGSGLANDDVPTAENGDDSTAFGLKAIGGGGGARYNQDGANGGSGGGAADAPSVTGGSARQPSSTDGGSGEPGGDSNDHAHGGAGGGGANQAGGNAYGGGTSGNGGNGKYFGDVFGENVGENGDFAGGGAGGGRANSDSPNPGVGGSGGGGDGGDPEGSSADSGRPNTGGGGGGGDSSSQSGADGGSGIVLIRYPIEQTN